MIGKAAVLADHEIEPVPSSVGRPICEARLTGDVRNDWARLTREGAARPTDTGADVVNRVYEELFVLTEGARSLVCSEVAYDAEDGAVVIGLTRPCLARQIRAIMSHPRHGPWHEEGGVVTPELPGTSADILPCLSELRVGIAGTAGDWDMAVLEYTQLAHLLYAVAYPGHGVGHDAAATLEVLNRRFLTLRSSPELGATARESFNLIASCGNQPNQFG